MSAIPAKPKAPRLKGSPGKWCLCLTSRDSAADPPGDNSRPDSPRRARPSDDLLVTDLEQIPHLILPHRSGLAMGESDQGEHSMRR